MIKEIIKKRLSRYEEQREQYKEVFKFVAGGRKIFLDHGIYELDLKIKELSDILSELESK